MGLLTFVQLLGFEKGIAAIVFGVLALRSANDEAGAMRVKLLSWLGIACAVFYITFILSFFSKNPQFIEQLRQSTEQISLSVPKGS
jgi:hypothetical protein